MRLLSTFICLVFVASWASNWIRAQDATLIRGVSVISMQDERSPIANDLDVLIVGDRFEAIGVSGSFDVPNDAAKIDGSGLFMIPGLADAHVHFDFRSVEDNEPSQFVRWFATQHWLLGMQVER